MEILRLKREIQEKRVIQSKLQEMQTKADELEKLYKDKFGVKPPSLSKQARQPITQKNLNDPKQQNQDLRKKSIEVATKLASLE
jgi:methylphosphotriester-DNA--protein-cysteine methyltransferase